MKTQNIANACEFNGNPERPFMTLFLMWAAHEKVYVWADGFESAFEELVEWLDDQKYCDIFTYIGEDELKEAADDLGIEWEDSWPDYNDEDYVKVQEHAEIDLTIIGHTTLKCEQGRGSAYLTSDEWGGGEIEEGTPEFLEVARASVEDCYGHDFMQGDDVWYNDPDGDDSGKYHVDSMDGETVGIWSDDWEGGYNGTDPDHLEHFDPTKHKKARTEGQKLVDFFKPPPLPKGYKGGGFMGLSSWRPRRRRRLCRSTISKMAKGLY
jgi:hypothetical protein